MKTLEEKKMIIKMARMFGQPVDQALIESVEREEKLAAALFGAPKKEVIVEEKIPILKEDEQPKIIGYEEGTTFLNRKPIIEANTISIKPAETNLQPPEDYKVQQVAAYLDTVSNTKKPPLTQALMDKEFEALRKTVMDLLQKVNTLSWGGGGTGIVRLWNADDLDRNSAQNGRFVKYQDGWFVFDEINPYEIIHNTTLVTSNTYVVNDTDYYIGVNCPEPVTIIIPSEPTSGREIVVKDESGNCETHNITVSGPVDNDANGFILAVNNGAIHMLFRGDYWRII